MIKKRYHINMLLSRKYYLHCFNLHPKIGARTLQKIDRRIEDFEALWRRKIALDQVKLNENICSLIKEVVNQFSPDEEKLKLDKNSINLTYCKDKNYPQLLREIPDYPPILYYLGEINNSLVNIAIVGSRKYSTYGKMATEKIASDLVNSGINIVSGLALGIDAIAHREAVKKNRPTWAVLGCGVDNIYPSSHIQLARKIIASKGAIMSEFPPGMPSFSYNFPIRNRIIAGLSIATLVTEGMAKSGSLITARCALDYNREVLTIPHSIFSAGGEGPHNLIKIGARLITSADDILGELNLEKKIKQQKAKIELCETPLEQDIIQALENENCHINELFKKVKCDLSTLSSTLTMLEIKGMVKNIGGNIFTKI
ncbi:DNA-protecting protein DprA [Candidatus Berkelbacteria bacterium CG_4_8_14_3_um_filter_33_6]|nr:MAG: DNA-protecting protein DprA [Candidatus Berkelbacteria bacterium CG23_combo_of_CG06-09_8_20_14_all_33_15]PIS08584.1 MAG: DNA-protecting protein DprA [Candidatus Berkelbacteria bacterium CG10_big_fil_rev_8_21_14_0_10_33_10]PIX31113.1 MAG: DNA-protecting protein DprA [Candidatus Berkelbacteria bacterium CG_4_8_14_3_um_filter_33_6]PIZ28312.1 MAG: DNA-protecting protein DprA [Candidatus Berkelbacteria bacterium CG_4_10_14_0_8_um_filter_35_9_33_8]